MSTKKSFSIPQGLASGLRTSIQSANSNHGQLHYDMMPLDRIEVDPANPRKLAITMHDIRYGINKSDPDHLKKTEDLQSLHDLAESIKKVGIRNAIEVYKSGEKYRIISGERRYLASILAEQHYVPARINQKMDESRLRYIQWVENINRHDLSLWEKYNNLVSMADAYRQEEGTEEMNEASLKKFLGVSDKQAYRYFCLLNAGNEILELVKLGKLTSVKSVQELVTLKSSSERKKLLEIIRKSPQTSPTSLNSFKRIMAGKKTSKRNFITLGKTADPRIAKYFIDVLAKQPELHQFQEKFNQIDWRSHKDINALFKKIIFSLEKHLIDSKEPA